MSEKNYLFISATIFAFFAFLHVVRLVTRITVQVGAVAFPLWGSWLVLFVLGAMSIWAFRLIGLLPRNVKRIRLH
jgi:hypothetical protein